MSDEKSALLLAVLRQVEITKIDYKSLGAELGCSPKAAAERWRRFYKKVKESTPNSGRQGDSAKPIGIKKQTHSPRKQKNVKFEESEESNLETGGEEPTTPSPPRKQPARRARVESFKEFLDGNEQESEDEVDQIELKVEGGAEEREQSWENEA